MRFLLIHGGFHGAWCWDRTIPELEAIGHSAIAIDLPGHGARRDQRSSLADRRDAILEVLQPGDVLVGHSGGGYDITLAADAAPNKVRHLIYLAAGVPVEGWTILRVIGGVSAPDGTAGVDRLTSEANALSRLVAPNASGRLEVTDYEGVRNLFYHDCDEVTARWAFDRLTPAPIECLIQPVHLVRFWKANLPRSFIRCLQDRGGTRLWWPTFVKRLGVEPLTIDSSHSPFLSRPRELAELFVRATQTHPIGPLLPDMPIDE